MADNWCAQQYFLLDPLHKQLKLRLPKLARGSPAERGFERFRSEAQSRGVQVRGTRDVDQDGLAGTVWVPLPPTPPVFPLLLFTLTYYVHVQSRI